MTREEIIKEAMGYAQIGRFVTTKELTMKC